MDNSIYVYTYRNLDILKSSNSFFFKYENINQSTYI